MGAPFGLFNFVFFSMFILIPLLIGIFVWRDAGRRGMNQLLWTLVAALIPYLLGLIVYLIVASQYNPLTKCPGCRNKVEQEFQICPHCGYQLQEACPQCNKPVSPDWNLCPSCGKHLRENL
ncbi:MAG: hypothetical protein FH749_12585 [Firmicutes bacterium]|nr:hypothetical protein [Bacillota bacterium]